MRRLSPAPAAGAPAPQPRDVRLSVTADSALLGTLAMDVAGALGRGAMVERGLADMRVVLRLPDIDGARLLRLLRETYDVHARVEPDVVRFELVATLERRRAARMTGAPLETRLVDAAPHGVGPAALAQAFCVVVASPRGAAAVLGRRVLVRDVPDRLARLDELVRQLAIAPHPRWPPNATPAGAPSSRPPPGPRSGDRAAPRPPPNPRSSDGAAPRPTEPPPAEPPARAAPPGPSP